MTAFSVTGYVNPATGLLRGSYDSTNYHILSGAFGSKLSSDVYHENLQDIQVGTITTDVGRLKMRVMGGSQIAASGGYAGGKVWSHNMATNEFPEVYINYTAPTQRAYHSCWFNYSGLITGTNCSWKFGRFGTGAVYNPNRYAHMYTSSGGSSPSTSAPDLTVDTSVILEYAATNDVTDHPEYFTPDSWHFYEIECYAGTVNGNDSVFKAYIDGKLVVQFTGSSLRTTANPDLIKWCLSFLTGQANAITNTMIFKVDEFYFDASRARVVMTNNAVWASSTKFSVQPIDINGWSESEIRCRKNGVGFSIGETGYLHVFDDSGTYLGVNSTVTVSDKYLRAA